MASPPSCKYGAPKLGSNVDAGRAMKLAQRVEMTLKSCVNSEPKQLDPKCLLVSPQNRDGAVPNVPYIHYGILRSLATKGFDWTRPQVGICIQCKSPESKERLLEWNRRFSQGVSLLPPIDPEQALYGTLAGTHLNLALRIIQAGLPSPACDVSTLALAGTSLHEVVHRGHKWWILPEDTPLEQQIEVSLWRNMDQNENQAIHEIEVLRNIIQTCTEMATTRSTLPIGDIVYHALRRSPAKVSDIAIENLAKFYLLYVAENQGYLARELQEFHAARVNPRDLIVPAAFFKLLALEFKGVPLVRHYLVLTQYTRDGARCSAGQPDCAGFLDKQTLVNLSKKTDLTRTLEDRFRDTRKKYLPILERQLTEPLAKQELADLGIVWIRCLMSKPLAAEWAKGTSTGKFAEGKAEELLSMWGLHVDRKYPDIGFLRESGISQPSRAAASGSSEMLELVDLKTLAQDSVEDQGAASSSGTIRPGDRVTVVRRFTWTIPLENNPDFRHDVQVGMEGLVEGFADENHRQVLVSFQMKLPSARGTIVRKVVDKAYPRNLVLTSDFQAKDIASNPPAPAEPAPKDPAAGTPSPKAGKLPKQWRFLENLEGAGDPAEVLVEHRWDTLLDLQTIRQSFGALKGKVALLAHALLESLPALGPKDLVVCNRSDGKGGYRTEVWTLRKFAPRELAIPVVSGDVRDLLWSKNLFEYIGVPANGPGAHPDGRMVAFDGRGKQRIASKGAIDDQEHRGFLCWAIERTDNAKLANLEVHQVSSTIQVTLATEGTKRRKYTHSWNPEVLPNLPILVNPRTINEHTRLFVLRASSSSGSRS